jgi:hypothetical protein
MAVVATEALEDGKGTMTASRESWTADDRLDTP